jgi:hypothetical protein
MSNRMEEKFSKICLKTMQLTEHETALFDKLLACVPGNMQVYAVGGWVRDKVRLHVSTLSSAAACAATERHRPCRC